MALIIKALIFYFFSIFLTDQVHAQVIRFDITKDLLLVHFDCKTDVDDVQSMAAFATLLSSSDYKILITTQLLELMEFRKVCMSPQMRCLSLHLKIIGRMHIITLSQQ